MELKNLFEYNRAFYDGKLYYKEDILRLLDNDCELAKKILLSKSWMKGTYIHWAKLVVYEYDIVSFDSQEKHKYYIVKSVGGSTILVDIRSIIPEYDNIEYEDYYFHGDNVAEVGHFYCSGNVFENPEIVEYYKNILKEDK